jgi:hypothetical protein
MSYARYLLGDLVRSLIYIDNNLLLLTEFPRKVSNAPSNAKSTISCCFKPGLLVGTAGSYV